MLHTATARSAPRRCPMAHTGMRLVAAALVLGLALSVSGARPASAEERAFTLYGDSTLGWGATTATMTTPGPTLVVTEGDNVTLTLNGTDSANHNWFIDYDNDTNVDADEPATQGNFRAEQIVWNFTADRAGMFAYRCRFHAAMWGNITIVAANATPPSDGSGSLLVVGVVAGGLVAVLAVATLLMRKKQP